MLAAAFVATASVSDGRAQSASCSNATLSSQAESGGTLAFVDAGPGNVIAFVCIDSAEFSGGEGGPFSANGAVAGGCFVIDGIGTDVVAVFREDPAVAPGCEMLTGISAGFATTPGLTPTATATNPATATSTSVAATATATRTVTTAPTSQPTSGATATSTVPRTATTAPPATSTMAPSQPPAATATPVRPIILPPSTGSGNSDGGAGSGVLFGGLAILMIAAGAGALFVTRKQTSNRS